MTTMMTERSWKTMRRKVCTLPGGTEVKASKRLTVALVNPPHRGGRIHEERQDCAPPAAGQQPLAQAIRQGQPTRHGWSLAFKKSWKVDKRWWSSGML